MPTLEEKLASHPLMKGLSTQDISLLAEDAMPMSFKADDMLFRQGQKNHYLFLIMTGKVTVGVKHLGAHLPITVIHAGGNLGWDWLFPPYKWEFEGRALTDVETIALEGKPIAAKMGRYPLMGYTLMRHLAFSLSNALTATRRELVNVHLETIKQEYGNKPLSSAELLSEVLSKTTGSVL